MSDRPPAEALYDLVVELLRRQGKGKTWLAQRSGVNRNTISNWQRQPRAPQPGSVIAVADALGIEHDTALRLAGLSVDNPPLADIEDLTNLPTETIVATIHRYTDELQRRTQD